MHASSILAQRRVSRRSRTAALPALPHRPRPAQRPKSGGCKCGSASRGKRAASGRPSPGRSRRAGQGRAAAKAKADALAGAEPRINNLLPAHCTHQHTAHTSTHCTLRTTFTRHTSTLHPPSPHTRHTLPRGRPTPPDPCTAESNYLWYAIETIRIMPWCIAQCASMSSTSQRVNAPDARRPVTYPRREALLDVHEIQLPNGLSPHPFPVGSLEPSLAAIAAQHACSGGATARGQRP